MIKRRRLQVETHTETEYGSYDDAQYFDLDNPLTDEEILAEEARRVDLRDTLIRNPPELPVVEEQREVTCEDGTVITA